MYETKYHGAPYGRDGEAGPEVAGVIDAARLAQRLNPGQRLDVLAGREVVARYEANAAGEVSEVEL